MTPTTPELSSLPSEIIYHIFKFMKDGQAISRFQQTSKHFMRLVNSETGKLELLLAMYSSMSILYMHQNHSRMLESSMPSLISRLERSGAKIPRFLGQICYNHLIRKNLFISQLDETRFWNSSTPAAIKDYGLLHGENYMGNLVQIIKLSQERYTITEITEFDDVTYFERKSNNLLLNFQQIVGLIKDTHFLPLPSMTPSAICRIHEIIRIDGSLLDFLVDSDMLQVSLFNEPLMRMIVGQFSGQVKEMKSLLLKLYKKGFYLSSDILYSQLKSTCSDELLQVLIEVVPKEQLEECALLVLRDMFGSNGRFNEPIVDTLFSFFQISEANAEKIILRSPSLNVPYNTRCFEQESVFACWTWITSTFGPDHEFAEYCFDDILLWMGEPSSRYRNQYFSDWKTTSLLNILLNQNIELFQPRHVEHLIRMSARPEWNDVLNSMIERKTAFLVESKVLSDLDSDCILIWLETFSNLRQKVDPINCSVFRIVLKESSRLLVKKLKACNISVRKRTSFSSLSSSGRGTVSTEGFYEVRRVPSSTFKASPSVLTKISTLFSFGGKGKYPLMMPPTSP